MIPSKPGPEGPGGPKTSSRAIPPGQWGNCVPERGICTLGPLHRAASPCQCPPSAERGRDSTLKIPVVEVSWGALRSLREASWLLKLIVQLEHPGRGLRRVLGAPTHTPSGSPRVSWNPSQSIPQKHTPFTGGHTEAQAVSRREEPPYLPSCRGPGRGVSALQDKAQGAAGERALRTLPGPGLPSKGATGRREGPGVWVSLGSRLFSVCFHGLTCREGQQPPPATEGHKQRLQ